GDGSDASAGDGVCETATGNGICTLRAAIQEANAQGCAGSIAINFSNVTGQILLGSALPNLDHDLSINGPGANNLDVHRNSGGSYWVFVVNAGRLVNLSGLTISNGSAPAIGGGGILNNDGSLTIDSCAITGNTASLGGGIYNSGGSSLTITKSTISGNTATGGGGGGIYNNNASLSITNSTISGNTTGSGQGGGIFTGRGASNATLTNCTVSSNTANEGGGIYHITGPAAGTLTLKNTIVAGNTASTATDFSGGATSQGYNLIGDADASSGSFNQTGDQTGTSSSPLNALLGTLQNNGGPTSTHALLSGSPRSEERRV